MKEERGGGYVSLYCCSLCKSYAAFQESEFSQISSFFVGLPLIIDFLRWHD